MWPAIDDLDLETTTTDKVLYVVVALPALGMLGAVLRVSGLSEQLTWMIVLPLLLVSFVAWHLGRAIRRARKTNPMAKHDAWRLRHTPSTRYHPPRMHPRSE